MSGRPEFAVTRLDLEDHLEVRVSVSGVEDLYDYHGPFVPDRMVLKYVRGLLVTVDVSGPYITPIPDPWGDGSLDYFRGQVFFRHGKDEPIPEVLHQGISQVQMSDPDLHAYLTRWSL